MNTLSKTPQRTISKDGKPNWVFHLDEYSKVYTEDQVLTAFYLIEDNCPSIYDLSFLTVDPYFAYEILAVLLTMEIDEFEDIDAAIKREFRQINSFRNRVLSHVRTSSKTLLRLVEFMVVGLAFISMLIQINNC